MRIDQPRENNGFAQLNVIGVAVRSAQPRGIADVDDPSLRNHNGAIG